MCYYIIRTSKGVRDAAIAQQVERILGKDEVTSSNLVSSLAVRVRIAVICISRCGSVWLERHVRDVEAAGSSPVTSTERFQGFRVSGTLEFLPAVLNFF